MKTKKLIKKCNKLIKKTKRIQKGGFFLKSKQMLINDIKEKITKIPGIIDKDNKYQGDIIDTWKYFFKSLSKEELDSVTKERLKSISESSDLLNQLKSLKENMKKIIITKITNEINNNNEIKLKYDDQKNQWIASLETVTYENLKTFIQNNTLNVTRLKIFLDPDKVKNKGLTLVAEEKEFEQLIKRPDKFLYFSLEPLPREIRLKRYLIENIFIIGDALSFIINDLFISIYKIDEKLKLPNFYKEDSFILPYGRDMPDIIHSYKKIDEYVKKKVEYKEPKKSKYDYLKSELIEKKIPEKSIEYIDKMIEGYLRMCLEISNLYLNKNKTKQAIIIDEYKKFYTFMFNNYIFMNKILYDYVKNKLVIKIDDDIKKFLQTFDKIDKYYKKAESEFYGELDKIILNKIKTGNKENKVDTTKLKVDYELLRKIGINNTSNNNDAQNAPTTILKFNSNLIVFKKIKQLYYTYRKLKNEIIKYIQSKKFTYFLLPDTPHPEKYVKPYGSSNTDNNTSMASIDGNASTLTPEEVLKRNPDLSFNENNNTTHTTFV